MSNERLLRFERLAEVLRGLGAIPELEPFLQTVISAAIELTDSEAASILEFDELSGTLRFLAAPWTHQESLRGMQVPVDASAAGWAYRNIKPLQVSDPKADSRHFSAVDFAAAFETHSLLAVPLLVSGKPLGVLEAVNKASAHYTEEDITILETLAAAAALAVQNSNLQRRIQASFSELSELDRLKSGFIAITSHELRTPLGLILGHATFLRELLGEEHREQLDVIIKNASKLKEIIESLSSVDNYQTGAARIHQRAISVARIIEEVVDSFADMASKRNITLKAELGRDDLFAEADGSKISIALSNLVKNSIMFTDEGGHVFVTGQAVPGYIKVSVADDGIGIPNKDLPRIFERFFQVESHLTRRHAGMGLGLSVAKVMIEMHGGRIWAESVEGKGSNFSFLLPINPAQAEAGSRVFMP
ncbi:MAG: GAF domain-containing protein [Chloroflexi bacterium]|nr:GAF domain-containing protein [Chloroflexota bacterium]